MNKRLLIGSIAALAIGVLVFFVVDYLTDPARDDGSKLTEQDFHEAARKQLGAAALLPAGPAPIDPSRSVRLAIAGLGLATDEKNRRLADLITVELGNAEGLDLVERQSLDAVLKEMHLSLSGLVRVQDAVRAGKLLRVDWFLLGSPVSLNGTNYIVVRVVDGHTGVLWESGAFASDSTPPSLASELGGFVRQCRQNAADAKSGKYLSVGSFEDFSLNSRHADFPVQLRSFLTASYQRTDVTPLEREFANTLLKEMHLGLAGMTEESATNAPVMQSAYWMVDGYYQSYEESGPEVELVISVRRIFGRNREFTLRGQPGELLFRRVKEAIDGEMKDEGATVRLSRGDELRRQLAKGKQIFSGSSTSGHILSHAEAARRRRNIEEATRCFETVLLLEPTHREAKIYLASCFQDFVIHRADEALNLYQELIESEINDSFSSIACRELEQLFEGASSEEKLHWFEAANRTHPNDFYQNQIKAARDQATLARTGTAEAEELAGQKLLEDITAWERAALRGNWALNFSNLGFKSYVAAFGTNRFRAAESLVALLPRMVGVSSNLAPYVIAGTVVYQVTTNTPVVAQFEESLEEASLHPERLFGPKRYFFMVSREVHTWAAMNGLYSLAAQTIEVRERVARQNFADALKDDDRMGLAFAHLKAEAWQQALDVFQSYSNRPVQRGFSGTTNRVFMPVFTGRQANYCREKLGLPVQRDPREFEMGTNCLCLHTPSSFQTDADGLWVATGSQLIRLDYDLQTNFSAVLPTGGNVPITALIPGVSNVWIGTSGAGLIEFDKAGHQFRRLTVKDGLMMDSISSLHLSGDVLWIGYGDKSGGGLGWLNVNNRTLKSFTLSLAEGTEIHRSPSSNEVLEKPDRPPRRLIQSLASGPNGVIYFSTEYHPVRQYRPGDNVWSACPPGSWSSMVGDAKRLFSGSHGNGKILGIVAWDIASNRVWSFKEVDGLPGGRVSALTLDGENLWIGGFGYVAVADAENGNVRKLAYVPADEVDQIQVGGGFVWAVFDRHLHRAPLPYAR